MSAIQVKTKKLPSGADAVELFVHNKKVGLVIKVDGGWLVPNRRKPVATVEQAAKQCLETAIGKHSNEIQKLRSILAAVLQPNDPS